MQIWAPGINPAGIGMYRRGDAGATMGIFSSKTNENSLSDGAVNNLGIALVTPSVNPDMPFFTLLIPDQQLNSILE